MSESCAIHGWGHMYERCPKCAQSVAELQRKADAWDGVCEMMRDPRYSNEAGGIYVRNFLNNPTR